MDRIWSPDLGSSITRGAADPAAVSEVMDNNTFKADMNRPDWGPFRALSDSLNENPPNPAAELQMTRENYGAAYLNGFERTTKFLVSRGVHRDNAKELAQAAWARGWEQRDQLRDESTVTSWVNTIALNYYRRLVERQNITLPTRVADTTMTDLAAIDLARILDLCRPGDRFLLQQHLWGVTTKEIAERQRISETAVRVKLLRARRTARDLAVRKEGVVPKLLRSDISQRAQSTRSVRSL
jgi:DNA-directed RNA polymerase specialized sigma24 family protein